MRFSIIRSPQDGTRLVKRVRALTSLWLAGVAMLVSLLACSVTLISRYDEQVDKAATSLQRQMDSFLTSLESEPQPTFEDSKKFYDEYAVDLRSVLVRAQSHPKNTLTEQQLELMLDSLKDLRDMHAAGPIDPAAVGVTRDLFNQSWGAIIKLETAKNRGD